MRLLRFVAAADGPTASRLSVAGRLAPRRRHAPGIASLAASAGVVASGLASGAGIPGVRHRHCLV